MNNLIERLAAAKDQFPAGSEHRKAIWEAMERLRHPDALTTQPPHQDRGEVDSLRALAELLAMPSGYEVVEHLPGIWHFTYPGDDGELMASSASWNHPAIAATEAWLNAALTEAKQQGPGEAESPSLKQTPAWWVGYSIGHTGRAPYHCAGPDEPPSRYMGDSVHWTPLYTAPPSRSQAARRSVPCDRNRRSPNVDQRKSR